MVWNISLQNGSRLNLVETYFVLKYFTLHILELSSGSNKKNCGSNCRVDNASSTCSSANKYAAHGSIEFWVGPEYTLPFYHLLHISQLIFTYYLLPANRISLKTCMQMREFLAVRFSGRITSNKILDSHSLTTRSWFQKPEWMPYSRQMWEILIHFQQIIFPMWLKLS